MKSIPQVLTSERLNQLLHQFSALKAGVIGDIGLDVYWYADMTRAHLSRETPHFPRPVVREAYSPGAGGNVAQNLVALGVGEVTVFSVFGKDTWGDRLKAELNQRKIHTAGILRHAARRTIAFIKPMLLGYNSQQEDARLDFESSLPLTNRVEDQLLAALERRLDTLNTVLIADQQELFEVITPRVRQRLNELAAANPRLCFLTDSRQRIGLFQNITLKPNWVEAVAAIAPERDPRQVSWAEMLEIGRRLSRQSGRPVFITLSENGVLVCTPDEQEQIAAAPVRPPLDVVGAGDTFIAALAAALSAGATPWEAGAIANLAAGVTVEKLNQTGTATPEEILARYELTSATDNDGLT
jgi:rfaE bifunctional protein kinase chain/domain